MHSYPFGLLKILQCLNMILGHGDFGADDRPAIDLHYHSSRSRGQHFLVHKFSVSFKEPFHCAPN